MDSATQLFYTVALVFVGALVTSLVRMALSGVAAASAASFAAKGELAGAVQPIAAFIKGPLEAGFGPLSAVKFDATAVLLAAILFTLAGIWSTQAAKAAAAAEGAAVSGGPKGNKRQ